ncbi:MAG: hypothetical protein ABWY00_11595 [Dongiaceae bacterium]
MKKPSLRPSNLHLQSVAEEKASLAVKVHHLLTHFERRRTRPSAWQGRQLDHALDCIADGLFSLAVCELEALTEHQRPAAQHAITADRGRAADTDQPRGRPAVTLSSLRRKLHKLSQPQQLT